jgi:hypothetical protein
VIRPTDFAVEFVHDDVGLLVRVLHRPTGARREERATRAQGGAVRDRLIAELTRRVFRPEDFVVDLVCGTGGSFLVARHLPSGRRGDAVPGAAGPDEREVLSVFVETLVRDGTITPGP